MTEVILGLVLLLTFWSYLDYSKNSPEKLLLTQRGTAPKLIKAALISSHTPTRLKLIVATATVQVHVNTIFGV